MATMSLQAAYDQARTYLETNRVDQAIGVAEHILATFPENLEAYRILGEAYLAGRQFDQAENAFSRVLRSDPEHIPAHVGLGITYERQGKLDSAVGEFEQALEIRPDMPELRSQLLRLYTDVWGAENATLRLSRPGLARLYAKGHMLPQAIQEFRSVLEEEPDRFDVWVGLAESLWRDGQTDMAAETCVDILAERSDVLKANLLLGYIRHQAGDDSGEPYWRLAQQLDPHQNLARALFDPLPDIAAPELEIPAWDEAAWAERQAFEQAEAERAAQQSIAVAPAVSATTAGDDFFSGWMDDIDTVDERPADAPDSRAAFSAPADDDFLASLLAMGADDAAPSSTSGGVDLDSSSGITPFSFDEGEPTPLRSSEPVASEPDQTAWDAVDIPDDAFDFNITDEPEDQTPFSLDELGINADSVPSETGAAEPDLAPLSFEELGLSTDEISALEAVGDAEPADEAQLEPFSLEDLGLSPDEIAALEAGESAGAAETTDEDQLEPFSLEDLGLSPDEIVALEAGESSTPVEPPAAAEPAATAEPDLTPFSLEDLGLTPDEIAALSAGDAIQQGDAFARSDLGMSLDADQFAADAESSNAPAAEAEPEPFAFPDLNLEAGGFAASDEPELKPFSLEELGLSPEELAALDAAGAVEAAAASEAQAFDPTAFGADETEQAPFEVSSDLNDIEPFSLDDLDLSLVGDDADFASGSLPPSLQPFSLDDVAPASPTPPPSDLPLEIGEDSDPSGGYSWQQPAAKKSTDFLTGGSQAEPAGPSIFSKLKQRAADLPREEPPPLESVSADDAEVAHFFSNDNDDVSLRDDDRSQPERLTGEFRLPREADGTPGSLAPSGAIGAAAAAGALAGAAAAQRDDTATPASETPETAEQAPVDGDEPTLTPFSLEDLGLSPEEIGALNSATEAAAPEPEAAEPELTPFSLEDLGLSPEEIAALNSATEAAAPEPEAAEPELTPFSLEDLGLSPEEIAGLGEAATGDTVVPGWSASESPELTPFSTDPTAGVEPIDFAEFDFSEPETPGAGAIEEGFEGDVQPFSLDDLGLGELDLGDSSAIANRELDLTDEELAGLDLGELETFIGEPPARGDEEHLVDTGDPALDRLIVLGQRQGYVDLTDIIAVVEDPEAEAERIEEIGWTLHRAGIQIRDGDEIIDMEEVDGVEEGDIEPFSADSADAGAAPTPEPVTLEGEAELTPFSLEELGLTPEEIAALGLAEAETGMAGFAAETPQADVTPEPAPAPEPAASVDAEPELTPFSLEELGLTPEEIAALGLAEAETGMAGFAAETPQIDATPEPAAPAEAEPELTPFSLEELGLSPEEIAALSMSEEDIQSEAVGADQDDQFDFGIAEEQPVEKVTKRTAPREEEPPPPVNPADAAFTPEALENLDSIWDMPEEPAAEPEPARVVLPPLSERAPARPAETSPADAGAAQAVRTRDEARYARREAIIAERTAMRKPGSRTPADFIPSGDESLDGYLRQMTAEPTNYPLALAIGRLSAQTGRTDLMALAYKRPIRDGEALEEIEAEVVELIETIEEPTTQRQLYRVLGDVYSKQGRFREAMTAYSQTYGRKEED